MLNGTQMTTWKESIPSSNPIKVWTILHYSKSIAWTFFSLWRFGIRDYKLGFLGTHDGHRQRSSTHRKCTESARGHLEHSGKNDESFKNYDIIVTIIFFSPWEYVTGSCKFNSKFREAQKICTEMDLPFGTSEIGCKEDLSLVLETTFPG